MAGSFIEIHSVVEEELWITQQYLFSIV